MLYDTAGLCVLTGEANRLAWPQQTLLLHLGAITVNSLSAATAAESTLAAVIVDVNTVEET